MCLNACTWTCYQLWFCICLYLNNCWWWFRIYKCVYIKSESIYTGNPLQDSAQHYSWLDYILINWSFDCFSLYTNHDYAQERGRVCVFVYAQLYFQVKFGDLKKCTLVHNTNSWKMNYISDLLLNNVCIDDKI